MKEAISGENAEVANKGSNGVDWQEAMKDVEFAGGAKSGILGEQTADRATDIITAEERAEAEADLEKMRQFYAEYSGRDREEILQEFVRRGNAIIPKEKQTEWMLENVSCKTSQAYKEKDFALTVMEQLADPGCSLEDAYKTFKELGKERVATVAIEGARPDILKFSDRGPDFILYEAEKEGVELDQEDIDYINQIKAENEARIQKAE